jgi:hypothetical protein
MSKSAIRLLPVALGLLLLAAACTPSSMHPHGGQPFPLVNPSFLSWPVQSELRELVETGMGEHLLCDPAKVGYCSNDYAPGY